MFLLANQNGATVPVVAALALSGALAGFLRFNLPPARIFLGDAGALAIGYLTAVLSLASYQKSPAAVALIVPLLVLGLPLLDTILAMMRRGLLTCRERGARARRAGAARRSDSGRSRTPAPPAAAERAVGRSLPGRPVRGLSRAGGDGLRTRSIAPRASLRDVRGADRGGLRRAAALERRAGRLEADAARARPRQRRVGVASSSAQRASNAPFEDLQYHLRGSWR